MTQVIDTTAEAPTPRTDRSDGERRRLASRIRVGGGAAHRPARKDIEGLRAIAVTLVLIVHAGLPPAGGFVGVDIFFVISGFLMTNILLRELLLENRISLAAFYARRARRLLPAATTVIVCTGIATLAFVPRIRWLDIGKDMLASGLFVQNWRLASVATDYNAQGLAKSPLQHFWSLAVEEQYYFIWPVLLLAVTWFIRRRRVVTGVTHQTRSITIALCVALGILALPTFYWSVHLTAANPDAAYFVTTTRLWELAIGGAAAIVAVYIPKLLPAALAALLGWLGLALLLGSAFVITDATPFPGVAALAPTVGTGLVIGSGVVSSRFGPTLVLGLRPLQWIGKLSYSLYLWHWPLLIIAAAHFGVLSETQGAAVVLVSVIPAYLSFKLVEDPLRRSRRVRATPSASLKLGGICLLASLAATAVVVGAIWPPAPPPAPVVISLGAPGSSAGADQPKIGALVLAAQPKDDPNGAPVDKVASITPDPLAAAEDNDGSRCIQRADETTPAPCTLGDSSSSRTVALVGDSHAAQWIPPLENIAAQRGWKLEIYSKQNCTFGPDITVFYEQKPYTQCTTWSKGVEQDLLDTKPAMVIFSDVFDPIGDGSKQLSHAQSVEPLEQSFTAAWKPLAAQGTQLVVIKDTPHPNNVVPTCVSQHIDQLTKCSTPRSSALRNGTPLEAAAKAMPGVTLINLEDAICPTKACAAVIGGVIVYRDNNHMTATYAATLAPRLNAALPTLEGDTPIS